MQQGRHGSYWLTITHASHVRLKPHRERTRARGGKGEPQTCMPDSLWEKSLSSDLLNVNLQHSEAGAGGWEFPAVPISNRRGICCSGSRVPKSSAQYLRTRILHDPASVPCPEEAKVTCFCAAALREARETDDTSRGPHCPHGVWKREAAVSLADFQVFQPEIPITFSAKIAHWGS